MKKRLFASLLLVVIVQFICIAEIRAKHFDFGQASSDYIVLMHGEIIYGNISRNIFGKYNTINFQHPNGEKLTYAPEEIAEFGFQNGKKYMSTVLPGQGDEIAFVQVLFSGPLNLLSSDSKFYISTADEIFELKKKYEDEKAKLVPHYRRQYVNILKVFMAGKCGYELKDRITTLKYKPKKLVDIFERYHECEDLEYQIHI